MAEAKPQPKAEVKAPANGLNKDGFKINEPVSDEDYQKHMAKLRQQAKK